MTLQYCVMYMAPSLSLIKQCVPSWCFAQKMSKPQQQLKKLKTGDSDTIWILRRHSELFFRSLMSEMPAHCFHCDHCDHCDQLTAFIVIIVIIAIGSPLSCFSLEESRLPRTRPHLVWTPLAAHLKHSNWSFTFF